MAQLPGRALAKLTIKGYKNPDFTGRIGKFIAPYNPTNLTVSSGLKITEKKTIGPPKSPAKKGEIEVKYNQSRTLSVTILLDGTGTSAPFGIPVGDLFGALPGASQSNALSQGGLAAQIAAQGVFAAIGVEKMIDKFFDVTTKFDASSHDAPYLKIKWGGGLSMKARITAGSVAYTLFNQLGKPLRATITASFIEIAPDIKHQFLSPDLTKTYVVQAGDTLYNIAKEEYDSESFYLQLAEANDLKNYRKLIPGQVLILPPIRKSE